jgi:3-phosphoshikimate 1-carboxyvinyltransferase
MGGLINALESHGAKFEFIGDEYCFPFKMTCNGLTSDNWEIDASNSSQIISAILLIAPLISGNTQINLINGTVSRPFVNMTLEMMKEFAREISGDLIIGEDRYEIPCFQYQLSQNEYQIEPDATAASYFLSLPIAIGGGIHINGIQDCKLQGDIEFCNIISQCGLSLSKTDNGIEVSFIDHINGGNFDFNDISDTFLTLAALSPLLDSPLKIYGIAHTRKQETDRVSGMVNELRKLGLNIEEEHDSIYIIPHLDLNKFIEQRPVEIETYKDHRFAMSFAILGSHDLFKDQQPWIRILDPQCCSKTFPRFFDVLSQCRSEPR